MSSTSALSKSDNTALKVTIVLGAVAAVITVVRAVLRILEIVPNRNVPVAAHFDVPATMPIGQGGSDVEVIADRVILSVSDMPPITLWSLILAEVFYALAVVAVVLCLCLVIRNIMRGQAFSSRTVWLVGTATIIVGVGWVLVWGFTTMGSNGAASALADEPGFSISAQIDFTILFAVAAMGALTAAFQVGHKLQRDTEGLV